MGVRRPRLTIDHSRPRSRRQAEGTRTTTGGAANRSPRQDEGRWEVNEYFEGAVSQLLERTRQLCDLIPAGLGREVAALEVACRDRLKIVGKRLRLLRDRPELRESDNQRERLRLFRRARGELDHLESVAVTALCRWNAEDRWMNQIAERLAGVVPFAVELWSGRLRVSSVNVTPLQQLRRRAGPVRRGRPPGTARRGSLGPAGSAVPPPPARSPPSVESSVRHATA